MATVTKTYYGSQGAPLRAVNMSDKLVIAQADSTGLEGYRTATINIQLAYDHIANRIKNTANGLVVVQSNSGLLGDGSAANPLKIDPDYFYKNWIPHRYVNISKVGNVRETSLPIRTVSGFTFRISEAIPVYLNGVNNTLAAQDINISNYHTSVANSTFYLYVILDNGLVTIKVEDAAKPERVDVAYIGKIQTNASAITTITTTTVLRIDKYRFSATPMGSAISVTDGNVADQVNLNWGGVIANTNTIEFTSAGNLYATTTISPVQRIYSGDWFGDVAEIYCASDANDNTEHHIKFSTLGRLSSGSTLPSELDVTFEGSSAVTTFTAEGYASDGSFKFVKVNGGAPTDFSIQMGNTTSALRAKLVFR